VVHFQEGQSESAAKVHAARRLRDAVSKSAVLRRL
jgi:hypothetical protein